MNLMLIVLFNLCSFSVSQIVFHFINESQTWERAQDFCRRNYSDLATVKDLKDLKNLQILREAAAGSDAWIGLHNRSRIDRTWHWSLPGLEHKESEVKERSRWNDGEPNDSGGPENCVYIQNTNSNDPKWVDDDCKTERCFICYDENTGSVVGKDTCSNWITAQHLCREKHTDLISGLDQLKKIHTSAWNENCNCGEDKRWWIGLFRDTWSWSDGSNSSFRNWSLDDGLLNKEYRHDDKNCVKLGPEGRFIRDNCTQPRPFICYDNLFILVKEKKTWEEALVHCRRQHRDLAWFIHHTHLKMMVQARAKMAAADDVVWVGLHYACFFQAWIWVNGHYVSDTDKNWKQPGNTKCGEAGAVETGGEHQWVKRNASETHYFICVCKGSSCK